MLLFTTPLFLAITPLVALLGLWALWRGKHRRHPVSSTRLWQNLLDSPIGNKKRSIDPLWLLIFLAALFAALALPGPRCASPQTADMPSVQVHWSLRSLGNTPPELFIQLTNPHNVAARLDIEYLTSLPADPWPEDLKTSGESITTADALHGLILHPPLSPDNTTLSLRLHSGHAILAAATFIRPDRPPFALLTRVAPGRRIDPALYRVFAVNPAARPNDPAIHPAVLLVDDPAFTPDGLPSDTLIVASPTTPLPGITRQSPFVPHTPTPASITLPPYINFSQVQIQKAQLAALSPEWTVQATLDNHPFLATRKLKDAPTLLWLAASPTQETNWPLDRSFVLYFSHLLAQTFPPPSPDAAADTRILDWSRTDLPLPASASPASSMETSLSPALGLAAIALLLIAIALFARRGRGV